MNPVHVQADYSAILKIQPVEILYDEVTVYFMFFDNTFYISLFVWFIIWPVLIFLVSYLNKTIHLPLDVRHKSVTSRKSSS